MELVSVLPYDVCERIQLFVDAEHKRDHKEKFSNSLNNLNIQSYYDRSEYVDSAFITEDDPDYEISDDSEKYQTFDSRVNDGWMITMLSYEKFWKTYCSVLTQCCRRCEYQHLSKKHVRRHQEHCNIFRTITYAILYLNSQNKRKNIKEFIRIDCDPTSIKGMINDVIDMEHRMKTTELDCERKELIKYLYDNEQLYSFIWN
eukprot:Lithocolla_globosa_v1_NODE_113_length_6217_cov_73.628043.p1 type:complete len:202 gc:universal NODE_113_length_6217_cov_73.628043:3400-2795(-)